jgi:hypothetical protein
MVAPKKNVAEVTAKAIYKVVRPSALQRMKQGPKPPPKPKDNHYTNNPASAGIQPPKKKYVKVMTSEEKKEQAIIKRMKVRAQQAKRKPRVPEQGN